MLVLALAPTTVRAEGGASVQADPALAFGEWNERVALDLPPAANGTAPEIALVASHHTADGVVGAGWRLVAASSIRRRSLAGGVPGFTADLTQSTFLLDGSELVAVTAPGTPHYQPETYDGSRLDYNAATDTWTRKRNGWTWTYGDTAVGATRRIRTGTGLPVCAAPCNTETWFVRSAVDPFGNRIDYTYEVTALPAGVTYPGITTSADHDVKTITYGAGQAVVTFNYVARPDVRVSFAGGAPVVSHRRLSQVRATAAGQLFARYLLEYEDQLGTDCNNATVAATVGARQSLLRKLVQTGDASTDPKRVLRCNTYAHSAITWYPGDEGLPIEQPFASSPGGATVDPLADSWAPMTADLDGNGRSDLIILAHRDDLNANYNRVYIATPDRVELMISGSGTSGGGDAGAQARSWQSKVNTAFDHDGSSGRAIVDLDGDQIPEIVYETYFSSSDVFIESPSRVVDASGKLTGLSWTAWTHALERCDLRFGQFADVDGDRAPDLIIRAHGTDGAGCGVEPQTRWIRNTGTAPWFDSATAVVLDVPLEATTLPAGWNNAVAQCPSGIKPPIDFNDTWSTEEGYLADQAKYDDFNDDGITDVAHALYACWSDTFGEWQATTASAYSEIFYGDGRGRFVASGLSAGPPVLLHNGNWGSTAQQRLSTGTLAMVDLDRDGHGELLQSTFDARGFGIGARTAGSIVSGFGVAVDRMLAPVWDGNPPLAGADIPVTPLRMQAWDCDPHTILPTWGDFDGDGFIDLVTVSDVNGSLVALLRRSNRTVAEGRMIATDNEHGGRTHLTWGFSAELPNTNPDLAANLEVIQAIEGPDGSRAMTYADGVISDGAPAFATATITNDHGGVEVYTFATSPFIRGKQTLGVRYREKAGSIEHVTVEHHGERLANSFYYALGRPYFNPLVRRCEYDVGFKTIDLDAVRVECLGVAWLAPAVAQTGGAGDLHVPVEPATDRLLLGHDRAPSAVDRPLYARIWTGTASPIAVGRRRIAPAITGTAPARFSTGIRAAFEGVSPVGSPDYFRWPTPAALWGVLPNVEAAEAAYTYPSLPMPGAPDLYVWDFGYDHAVRKLVNRYEHRDLATTADDRSIGLSWNQPLTTGYWYELASEETRDAANARLARTERTLFAAFDAAQNVRTCGRTTPADCATDKLQYFANGTLKKHTFPDLTFESWTRLAWSGEPLTSTDALGRVTTYTRNTNGTLQKHVADGVTSRFTYDALLRPIKQTVDPGAGVGATGIVTRTFYYDDALTHHADVGTVHAVAGGAREDSTYEEPRHAIRRGDGQLELVYTDGLGRTTRRTECADTGTDVTGGDISRVGCQAATKRHVEWNLYAASGPLAIALGSFEPGETPTAAGYGYDGQHRPIVVMQPIHEPNVLGWQTATIEYGDGYEERNEPTSTGTITTRRDHSTLSEAVAVGNTARGGATKNVLGQTVRSTGPDGTGTDFIYDGQHRLAREVRVDAAGAKIQEQTVMPDGSNQLRIFEHTIVRRDARGRVLEEVLPDDTVLEYHYDAGGRITGRAVNGTLVQSLAYTNPTTTTKGTVQTTDELGGASTTRFVDGLGRPWVHSGPRLFEQWTYDSTGRLVRTTGSDGIATDTYYDIHDQPATIVNPASGTTTLDHDGAGRLVSQTDADGVTDRFSYTYSGAPYQQRRGDILVAERTYDPRGHVIAARDGGVATASEYDSLGRLTKRREGVDGASELRVTTYFYDTGDRVTELRRTPVAGLATAATRFRYDGLGRMTEQTDPSGDSTVRRFDGAGRVRKIADQEGAVRETVYDDYGRVTDRQLPNGRWERVRYLGRQTYGTESKLWAIDRFDDEDAARSVKARRYVDGTGHVLAELAPDGTSTTHTWLANRITRTAILDAAGVVDRATDYAYEPATARLASTTQGPYALGYEYTAAGRTLRITTPDDVLERRYENGLLASVTEAGVQRRYGREPGTGWVVTEATQVGTGPVRNLEIGRDRLGRIGLMEYSVSDQSRPTVTRRFTAHDYFDNAWLETSTVGTMNVIEARTFDDQGRPLTRVTSGTGLPAKTTAWEWYGNGVLAKLTTPSGQALRYDYGTTFDHELDRVLLGTTTLASVDARDLRGSITGVSLPTISQTRTIGYDDAGRVASRVIGTAPLLDFEWQATFNPDGTLASETIDDYAASNGWVNHYGYDAAGRLVLEVNGKTETSNTYALDAAGNRLTTTTTVGAGTPAVTMTASYVGPRLDRVDGVAIAYDAWNAVATDHHGNAYTRTADGELAALANGGVAIFARNAHGEPIAGLEPGPVQRRTTWGFSSAALPLEVDEGDGNVLTYLTVEGMTLGTLANGTLTSVTSDARATPQKYGTTVLGDASAFGVGLVPPAGTDDRFTFAMLERVPSATQVMLARHRTYDPTTGRFLEPDPAGADIGGAEVYHYGANDPINRVDPSGFASIGDTCGSTMPNPGLNPITPRTYDFIPMKIGDAALGPADILRFDLDPDQLTLDWEPTPIGGMPGGSTCVANCMVILDTPTPEVPAEQPPPMPKPKGGPLGKLTDGVKDVLNELGEVIDDLIPGKAQRKAVGDAAADRVSELIEVAGRLPGEMWQAAKEAPGRTMREFANEVSKDPIGTYMRRMTPTGVATQIAVDVATDFYDGVREYGTGISTLPGAYERLWTEDTEAGREQAANDLIESLGNLASGTVKTTGTIVGLIPGPQSTVNVLKDFRLVSRKGIYPPYKGFPPWKGPTDYVEKINPGRGKGKTAWTVRGQTKPSPRMVRLIKEANREHNDGLLRSDQSGQVLFDSRNPRIYEYSPYDAQIDHKKPVHGGRSKKPIGGTRSLDNLQILSAEENREKW